MNGTGEQTAALNHEDLAQLAWRHWQTRPGERGINQTSRNPTKAPASRDHLAIRLAALARLGAAHR